MEWFRKELLLDKGNILIIGEARVVDPHNIDVDLQIVVQSDGTTVSIPIKQKMVHVWNGSAESIIEPEIQEKMKSWINKFDDVDAKSVLQLYAFKCPPEKLKWILSLVQ